MDAMMYKIEGEDLYLIGTSRALHDRPVHRPDPRRGPAPADADVSYSPCFRKEKGAHGIEERGVYRIHQFEKQEMIVVCKPGGEHGRGTKSCGSNTVELFRSLDIPVRTAGVLLRRPRRSEGQEPATSRRGARASRSILRCAAALTSATRRARRLQIRIKGEDGKNYLAAHAEQHLWCAPPRMLIAFLENNLQPDGSVVIPEVLRPYMGGKEVLVPKH